jgi:putative membrane protein
VITHLIHLLVFAFAVFLSAKIVPGIKVRSFGGAVFFAFILAILNKLLYTAAVFLSLPFVLLTFGFFLLVINAVMWLLASKIVDGVETDGFWAAFLGSLITTVINYGIIRIIH